MQIGSTCPGVYVCMCPSRVPSSSAWASFQPLVMRGFTFSTFKQPRQCVLEVWGRVCECLRETFLWVSEHSRHRRKMLAMALFPVSRVDPLDESVHVTHMCTINVYNVTTPKQRFCHFVLQMFQHVWEVLTKSFICWDGGGCPTLQTSFASCLLDSSVADLQAGADEKAQKRKTSFLLIILSLLRKLRMTSVLGAAHACTRTSVFNVWT